MKLTERVKGSQSKAARLDKPGILDYLFRTMNPETHISPPIARIILYVKDIPRIAAFYQRHFGMTPMPGQHAGWLELRGPEGGCTLALHQAAKSQKNGAAMKIVFAMRDVSGFVARCEQAGLKFGVIHKAIGFEFANARDPAGNAISVSSRGLA